MSPRLSHGNAENNSKLYKTFNTHACNRRPHVCYRLKMEPHVGQHLHLHQVLRRQIFTYSVTSALWAHKLACVLV